MRVSFILFLVLFGCHSDPKLGEAFPSNFSGKVVAIKDGDTFKILCDGKERSVRLSHIDCPEKMQPFGSAAKKYASDLCFGKIVTVVGDGKTDRYQRLIAEVYLDELCINKELVKEGFAWHFTKYSNDKEYAELEKQARLKKVGIWGDSQPVPPWNFRTRKPSN